MSELPKFHQITKIQISYRKKERSVGIAKHSIFRSTEKRYPYVTTAAAQQQLSSSPAAAAAAAAEAAAASVVAVVAVEAKAA